MTHPELYSDGVGQITVTGGVVRVDLVSLSPTERDANNNPKATFRQRLIFSLEGFVNSAEAMQKILQGLFDAGVVQRTNVARTPLSVPEPPRPSNVAHVPPSIPEPPRPRKGVYHGKH
jgi:hypothetical protein